MSDNITSKANNRTSNNVNTQNTTQKSRLQKTTSPIFGLNPKGFSAPGKGSSSALDAARQSAIKNSKKQGSYNAVSSLTYGSNNVYKKSPKSKDISSSKPIQEPRTEPDETYKWNLPPHAWSLPVEPSNVSSDTVEAPYDADTLHSHRRGRIFLARKNIGANTLLNSNNKINTKTNKNFKSNYGFQFLWNPETFSQSTEVNWGITPDQNDATANLTGLVASNSHLNITVRIDRTNDFACMSSPYSTRLIPADTLAKFYTVGQAPFSRKDFTENMTAKIEDLIRRGTASDIEYLYRTINGDGYNQFGVDTSNISYLMPTIVRIDLGPYRTVGMIQAVSVTHLAFTRDMIPIRSEVALSIDLKASTQFATSNFLQNSTPSASSGNPYTGGYQTGSGVR